ncbi:hypothetical protein [Sandarakinorhabdus sp.]|uniref:hypothetical protein n=1 Tax=Sandarakinorhabdus sp. TaxID=1916663 RepID=UPI00286E514F|nr:hypothetical protein [Sandarakinorhabdus sp.]
MEIRPLTAQGLPLAAKADDAKAAAKAGQEFEALLVTRLLKTARAAKLGDDLMGSNDTVRDHIDEQRGRAIASAAPLGLAQLLAREAAK